MTEVRLTATTPDGQVVYVLANEKGELKLEEPIEFDGNVDGNLNVTGSAEFGGSVSTPSYLISGAEAIQGNGSTSGTTLFPSGGCYIRVNKEYARNTCFGVWKTDSSDEPPTVRMGGNGEVAFAGGKAGFTEEGNLFCTTIRGDLVVLENTSGGFGAWVEYTRSSRRDQVVEKLEEWSEKDKSPEIKPIQD